MSLPEWSVQPTDDHRAPSGRSSADLAPLTFSQVATTVRAAARELTWGLPAVRREVRHWQAQASLIPAAAIRSDALSALKDKRGHIDGAGLFSSLPRNRNRNLLRLLVAYEVIWDFLDSTNEHAATEGQINGRQLHLALIDALDPARPISDYYRYHPWKEDGGYLRGLVETCRTGVAQLPSYPLVRSALIQEATRAQVLAMNHEPNPSLRDATLRAWAARELPQPSATTSWFELTAAASASTTVHALLALAAEPAASELELFKTRRAYFPWISAVATMLDSYVDQTEDLIRHQHSYISHYPTQEHAERRLEELIRCGLELVSGKPDGDRHALIVACMIALYLSKDSARAPEARHNTRQLICAGGTLTRLLLPVLRLWRIAYDQRSAT